MQTLRAAPEPEPVPRRWQLRIDPGELRLASVDAPGIGPRAYLYFTYKVTNNTGEDRNFAPVFEMVTYQGMPVRSGRAVPRAVIDALTRSMRNPFLLDEISVQGPLLQGEENAKEGLVVWPADELKPGTIDLFAAGFSGETKAVTRPDNGQKITLRKTLMLRHEVSGEMDPRSGKPIPRASERWILR